MYSSCSACTFLGDSEVGTYVAVSEGDFVLHSDMTAHDTAMQTTPSRGETTEECMSMSPWQLAGLTLPQSVHSP